jgi:Cyanobacterial TRADD-N associated 2-Transmembrane domain
MLQTWRMLGTVIEDSTVGLIAVVIAVSSVGLVLRMAMDLLDFQRERRKRGLDATFSTIKLGGMSVEVGQEREARRRDEALAERSASTVPRTESSVGLRVGTGASMSPTPANGEPPPADVADLGLMEAYHAQGLAQSKVSFWFSMFFASLGFALIAVAVATAALGDGGFEDANTAALLGGAVVEGVSALFFVQSNRSRVLMTNFFDKLRADRATREAVVLAESIEDDVMRSRLQATLALQLAGGEVSDEIARSILADHQALATATSVDGSPLPALPDQVATTS